MEERTGASGRLSRRDLLRRGAIVGGSLLWVAPAIQTLAPRASAHVVGSPVFGCCECRQGGAGAENCSSGVGGLECTTVGARQPPGSGPASSAGDCQSYCAGLNKSFCFHAAPTPLSCVPAQAGRQRCQGH